MPKFEYTERIIEADDEDEASDRFRDDDTIFYAIETEPIEPAEEAKP